MLTIYRASAGTGKTHVLTGEYLQLLFSGVDIHAKILSVTFTNKASDEMKSRIITELHRLSSGEPSVYLPSLMAKHRKTEEDIRRQARNILIRILHDYSRFNVSTIDHFFQQTIRAFVRETGIHGNYQIEMDKDLVLAESIDNLLAGLDRKENKKLLEWLLRFSEDKVEKGENWELRHEIKKLANELFTEKYKSYSNELEKDIADKQALTDYQTTLFAIIRSTEAEAKRIGEEALSILKSNHLLPSDFKGQTRSPLFFFERLSKGAMKEPSDTFKNLADNVEACYIPKTNPQTIHAIENAFHNGLNDYILRTVHFFDRLTNYHTAKEIIHYYYTLGILTDISRHIKVWREEKNRMLIADTNELLDKIINGSDVPFIYEKTGTYIDHFMIDEFQDTSRMQWSNFRPLIKESLAYNRSNLIVGDIKQSIYRFRNSDWTLLDEHVKKDFTPQEIVEQTLTENWRSHRLIVEFNNAFFTIIPVLLQEIFNQGLEESALDEKQKKQYATKITDAYQHSFQYVSPPRQISEGHIRIDFLPDEDDKTWKQEAMNRLPAWIEKLQEQGYSLRDMAILVRTKAEGVDAANTLLAYGEAHPDSPLKFDVISEDALIIGNSFSVRFIVSMLKHLNRPYDPVAKQLALMAHAVMYAKAHDASNNTYTFRNIPTDFPAATIAEIKKLSQRSFYEMIEGIYRLFKADYPENEQAYVQAFLDLVANDIAKEPADTGRFLQWWEETGCNERITTPDSQNAIRILTIHKSKGLGFKVVIIPFGDWDVDQKGGSILWCHPQKAPFDKLPIVPVSYSKELSKTLFAEDYYHEKLHAFIDNLNALYVACTRAKEELILFVPDETVKRRKAVSKLIGETLQTNNIHTTRSGEKIMALPDSFHMEEGVFECGKSQNPAPTPPSETLESPMQPVPSILPDERIMLKLHRNGGFFNDEKRKYGILMHEILRHIQTKADIHTAIINKENAGEINKQESAGLAERIGQLLDLPDVKKWFDGSVQVKTEAEILFGNGQSLRPDRIMFDNDQAIVVDYKFGDQENPHDRLQVKKYMSLIRESGYQHVQGYLWYIELNQIIEVH
ncbi:MAG: UvrD-helicase domain-containing protein [Tannerella sp.]|jgi:ATP-dependent exoDNAse (exonuclease V) beta subunit|nr:UvrD-helicase domain-containing protein [Tannerella sp.]